MADADILYYHALPTEAKAIIDRYKPVRHKSFDKLTVNLVYT